LALCPVAGGWVLAIVDSPDLSTGAINVTWGDVMQTILPDGVLGIPREALRPEAGAIIGKRYASVGAARDEIQRYRKD